MTEIKNKIMDAIHIIEEYEGLFASGKFNKSNALLNNNLYLFMDIIKLVINCFISVDAEDSSGYQKYWLNIMKNLVSAVKSGDVFFKYDILCYDIKDGLNDFIDIIGE